MNIPYSPSFVYTSHTLPSSATYINIPYIPTFFYSPHNLPSSLVSHGRFDTITSLKCFIIGCNIYQHTLQSIICVYFSHPTVIVGFARLIRHDWLVADGANSAHLLLQCVAVCCSVWQSVAVCCSVSSCEIEVWRRESGAWEEEGG